MWSWVGVIVAGLLNGSFAVPIKTVRAWKFHHLWGVHSWLAMAVIPWVVALVTIPSAGPLLAALPGRGWMGLIGLGILFGIASLLYGVAVDLLGIALGFAIQLGLSIVLGGLELRFISGALALHTLEDFLYLAGLTLMVGGVVLCAQAGGAQGAQPGATGARFRKGLMIAIIGGILAPTLGLGIQYGSQLLAAAGEAAADHGFPNRIYLAWAIFLCAAAVVQSGYCLAHVSRNRQGALFHAPGWKVDVLQVLGMSSLWIASVFVYGRSVFALGRLGPSLGWPIFIAFIILASNAWGAVLGEWKGADRRPFRRMLAGSAVLVVAAFLVAQGGAR